MKREGAFFRTERMMLVGPGQCWSELGAGFDKMLVGFDYYFVA